MNSENTIQQLEDVITELISLGNPVNVEGMARFGISGAGTLGISIPTLRAIAKGLAKDHALAQALWESGYHEARILAAFIDDPKRVTPEQMDLWTSDFDSWDVCDQVCGGLWDRTPYAYDKARLWSEVSREYVRRAGFATMAALSVHDKTAPDSRFLEFLPVIRYYAFDDRNFVKKAVNWALRQIGKRNPELRIAAIATAELILLDAYNSGAKWIARDALRELRSR